MDERHKFLVFNFLDFLRETIQTETEDHESLDVASQCLSSFFGVDLDDVAQRTRYSLAPSTLLDILSDVWPSNKAHTTGVPWARMRVNLDPNDPVEQFRGFLVALDEKGYFEEASWGTEEFSKRYATALGKFQMKFRENTKEHARLAEEAKGQGNEFMKHMDYEKAIKAYTEAIECQPFNETLFGNRAAAHSRLDAHANAVEDCIRSIIVNPNYAKGYSRMGFAYFHMKKYEDALNAYKDAVHLEPNNTEYQEYMRLCEKKATGRDTPVASVPPEAGMPGGLPDLGALLNNPQLMNMASQVMQSPGFTNMMQQMMSNPDALGSVMSGIQNMVGGAAGNATPPPPSGSTSPPSLNPFVNPDFRAKFLSNPTIQELSAQPKFKPIIDDIVASGPQAIFKYSGDPEVMEKLGSVAQQLMAEKMGPGNAGSRP